MQEYRFDKIMMLLSTDWFFPHWPAVGLNVALIERTKIQDACRLAVEHVVSRAPADLKQYWLTDFSPERVAKSQALLAKELNEKKVPPAVVSSIDAFIQGQNPSIDEATQELFIVLTKRLLRGDSSGKLDVAPTTLEALRAAWSRCRAAENLDFHAIGLESTSRWDEYIRSLTPDLPMMLADQAWSFAEDQQEFACLWEFIQNRLTEQERTVLLAWYHVAALALTDNPLRLPLA